MFQPAYPISTERLYLRPFLVDDLDAFHAIQSRPDVARYMYWSPRTREEVADVLDKYIHAHTLKSGGDTLDLAVVRKDTDSLIGSVMLRWLSAEHHQGEIGFILHPDHHGRGYGREAALAMLRIGFEDMDFHRIIGRCDGRNAASAGLMQRLDMRREAHLIHNEIVKDEWTDELVFAMLAEEWARR